MLEREDSEKSVRVMFNMGRHFNAILFYSGKSFLLFDSTIYLKVELGCEKKMD